MKEYAVSPTEVVHEQRVAGVVDVAFVKVAAAEAHDELEDCALLRTAVVENVLSGHGRAQGTFL